MARKRLTLYLKRIEMTGFKSFADRTVLELQKGLTAIVGPNGSGKSNIVEAIRWTLGEPNARELRSEKMTDVIFGGSKQRRAKNFAQVQLVFAEEEQPEEEIESNKSVSNGPEFDSENHEFINREDDEESVQEIIGSHKVSKNLVYFNYTKGSKTFSNVEMDKIGKKRIETVVNKYLRKRKKILGIHNKK